MSKFQNPFKLKKFYLHLFVFVVLILISISGSVERKSALLKNLTLTASLPVYAIDLPTPTPTPVVQQGIVTKTTEEVKLQDNSNKQEKVLAGSTRSSVCTDEKDPWTIVPNGDDKEIYTICNVKTEKMATAEELNVAQNNYRAGQGKSRLSINSGLCGIAEVRAREIAKSFSHSGFEGAVKGSGLGFSSYGENIASGPLSATRFVEWSWDKSSGHRANMLGDWSDGCGGVSDKYAVFLFAK